MNRKIKTLIGGGILATAMAAGSIAGAAVTFDAATGTGFVGKGDVQLALGLNNKQLQEGADSLVFTVESTTVTETTWTCDRDAGPQTQERANTETTTTQGVASSVARVKNQITGFSLSGYVGDPETSSETDGPQVGSCPTGWTAINLVEGQPAPVGDSGVFVNGISLQPAEG